jgi:hypothetical protein
MVPLTGSCAARNRSRRRCRTRSTGRAGRPSHSPGIQAAPAGRNITKQRFYRSQSGSVGTDFYFIAERTACNANFVDTVAPDAFAEPLPSRHYNAPPDGSRFARGRSGGNNSPYLAFLLGWAEPAYPAAHLDRPSAWLPAAFAYCRPHGDAIAPAASRGKLFSDAIRDAVRSAKGLGPITKIQC